MTISSIRRFRFYFIDIFVQNSNSFFIGGNWPATVALWLVEGLTWKSCDGGPGDCRSTAETEVRTIYRYIEGSNGVFFSIFF